MTAMRAVGAASELVRVENLSIRFPIGGGRFRAPMSFIHAVDGLSFGIPRGESLALVGESGSGKTTTGKLLVRLLDPTAGRVHMSVGGGSVVDLAGLSGRALKHFRRHVQMIFQDPYESLNPRRTIYDTVAEPLLVQGIGDVLDRQERVAEMLHLVGLTPPSSYMFRYPHELSGGQRQRIAIARALVIEPAFVVADEPTSMLDVSVRTGIMRLMQDLAARLGVTYLYITHDLAVARYMATQIAVMYLGKIVEIGPAEEVLQRPQHPYTQALLAAVPIPDPRLRREPIPLKGGISKPVDPPPRCRFYDRCPLAQPICATEPHPPLRARGPEHEVACYVVP
jgi:oligopeptide/dipeptide ABC transporter ATP-binding protein